MAAEYCHYDVVMRLLKARADPNPKAGVPLLLAATGGAWNDALDSMLLTGVRKPAEPSTWLEPSGEAPLHFRVQGAGNEAVRFVPYFLVQEELFEVYPAV